MRFDDQMEYASAHNLCLGVGEAHSLYLGVGDVKKLCADAGEAQNLCLGARGALRLPFGPSLFQDPCNQSVRGNMCDVMVN